MRGSNCYDETLPSHVTYARLLSSIRERLAVLDEMPVLAHLSEDQQRYLQLRESSLHRLEGLQDAFFEHSRQFVEDQAKATRDLQTQLEAQYAERAKKQEEAFARQHEELELARAALAKEREEADLRDSTVVRRSIRGEVKTMLQERLRDSNRSGASYARRFPVLMAYLLLLTGLGVVAASLWIQSVSSVKSEQVGVDLYLLMARQVLVSAAFVATAGFFIRWLNDWAHQHAEETRRLRSFELDFERASFVVEWAMEWAKEKQEVPEFLIERLSRGIFEPTTTEPGPSTAADAVASAMFGSAASAELDVAGQKLKFDRRGIKRLMKTEVAEEG